MIRPRLKTHLSFLFFFCVACFPLVSYSQSSTLQEYEYDPLGRLRVVETNGTSKVEYCYDKAGNRKAVGGSGTSANCATGNEPPPPPTPPAEGEPPPPPTGLTKTSYWAAAWVARWTPSPGTTHYELKFGSMSYYTVPASETEHSHGDIDEPPTWIKACNDNGCSTRVYF